MEFLLATKFSNTSIQYGYVLDTDKEELPNAVDDPEDEEPPAVTMQDVDFGLENNKPEIVEAMLQIEGTVQQIKFDKIKQKNKNKIFFSYLINALVPKIKCFESKSNYPLSFFYEVYNHTMIFAILLRFSAFVLLFGWFSFIIEQCSVGFNTSSKYRLFRYAEPLRVFMPLAAEGVVVKLRFYCTNFVWDLVKWRHSRLWN